MKGSNLHIYVSGAFVLHGSTEKLHSGLKLLLQSGQPVCLLWPRMVVERFISVWPFNWIWAETKDSSYRCFQVMAKKFKSGRNFPKSGQKWPNILIRTSTHVLCNNPMGILQMGLFSVLCTSKLFMLAARYLANKSLSGAVGGGNKSKTL